MRFTCCWHSPEADCLLIACYSAQDVSRRDVEPPRLSSGRAALWIQHRGHKGIHDCMQSCSGGGAGCDYCTSRASDSFFLFSFRFIFLVWVAAHFFYCQWGRIIVVFIYDMSILRIQMGAKGRESEGVS